MRELVGEEEAAALEAAAERDEAARRGGAGAARGRPLRADGARHPAHRPEGAGRHLRPAAEATPSAQHRMPERGTGGERADDTKPTSSAIPSTCTWSRPLMNAMHRNGAGTPLRAGQATTSRSSAPSTRPGRRRWCMLDMSYSMLSNDLWMPAKKVAIALESLIRGQFPRDHVAPGRLLLHRARV